MFVTLIIVLSCFGVLMAGIIAFSNIVDRIDKKKHTAGKLIAPRTRSKGFLGIIEAPYKALESAVKSYTSTHRNTFGGLTGKLGVTGIVGTRGYIGSTGIGGGTTGIRGITGSYRTIHGSTGMDDARGWTGAGYGCTGAPRDVPVTTTPPPQTTTTEMPTLLYTDRLFK